MAKTRKRPRHFVLDGSVAMAWFFKDESSPYTDRVAGSFSTWRAVVPAIWHLEIANAVLMGERRGRSTEAQASRWFTYLRSLPVALDEETNQHAWGDVLHLGAPISSLPMMPPIWNWPCDAASNPRVWTTSSKPRRRLWE
jgi:hypothetical protein